MNEVVNEGGYYAIEKGNIAESSEQQYQDGDKSRQASEASYRHSFIEGREEQEEVSECDGLSGGSVNGFNIRCVLGKGHTGFCSPAPRPVLLRPSKAQEDLYYIATTKHKSLWPEGVVLWWGPNRRGYSSTLEGAGKYTLAEATEICKPPSDLFKKETFMYPVKDVDKLGVTVVDLNSSELKLPWY